MTWRYIDEEVGLVGRTKRVKAIVAGAVLGAVLLGGCSPRPGTAAVVDGVTITQATVDAAIADLSPILATASPANVMSLLIIAPRFLEAAEAGGFGVTDAEARDYIVQAGLVTEAQAAEMSAGALEVVRFAVMQGSVTTDAAVAALDEANAELQGAVVELNPRYGTWDSTGLTVTAPETPWIVTPGQ